MKFDVFLKSLEKDVADFAKYWKEQNAQNPEQFPVDLDLRSGDWFEQFMFFLQTESNSEES